MTILLLEPLHAEAEALLAAFDAVVRLDTPDAAALAAHQPVAAILTRGRGQVTAPLMDACAGLRVVARAGVGLDNIDLAAARARGIVVVYAPGSTTGAVAEHTLLLMLAAARRLRPTAAAVHSGNWEARAGYLGVELAGRTLGIIGLGAIGRRVAALVTALGMRVVTWSRESSDPSYPALALDDLLRSADVVSLHVALTPETRRLIGARELALLKPDAILINTARGQLIDQVALAAALAEERLGAFAADVFDPEPPAPTEPLLADGRVLLTPHVAAITDVTYRAMCVRTAANVLAVLRGDRPEDESIYRW